MLTHNLGYPRIGAQRQLKKACEAYWADKISLEQLQKAGKVLRKENWLIQRDAGEEMIALLERAMTVIPAERIWVNPDCGLKTRGWPEVEAALINMMRATRLVRERFTEKPA
jgi:hypothetical protein